jgi:AICAR transformylase/IMP cyclohydrolase PurH
MPISVFIQVPDSIAQYREHLHEFFMGMILKLDKNSHKETPTKETIPKIMDLLRMEIAEFEEQMDKDKFDENSLIELMDQANFSFLAYVALRMQGVEHGPK